MTTNTNQETTVSDTDHHGCEDACGSCCRHARPEQHPASNSDARKRHEEESQRAVGTTMRGQIREALIEHSYSHELDECMCGSRGGLEHVAGQVALVVAPYVQPKGGA